MTFSTGLPLEGEGSVQTGEKTATRACYEYQSTGIRRISTYSNLEYGSTHLLVGAIRKCLIKTGGVDDRFNQCPD